MEPLITAMSQMAFVVTDLMESVKLYNDVYGVGPWIFVDFNENNLENVIHEGKPITYAIKLAVCNKFPIQIELIEPLDDKSTFGKFLKEHGPGLHHICIQTSKGYHETLRIMEKNGAPAAQTAVILKEELCAFTDNLKKLGTFFEIQQRSENFKIPTPGSVYPPGAVIP